MDLRRVLFLTVFIASLLATSGCGLILDSTPTERQRRVCDWNTR
jgi:hypothetical protein